MISLHVKYCHKSWEGGGGDKNTVFRPFGPGSYGPDIFVHSTKMYIENSEVKPMYWILMDMINCCKNLKELELQYIENKRHVNAQVCIWPVCTHHVLLIVRVICWFCLGVVLYPVLLLNYILLFIFRYYSENMSLKKVMFKFIDPSHKNIIHKKSLKIPKG